MYVGVIRRFAGIACRDVRIPHVCGGDPAA